MCKMVNILVTLLIFLIGFEDIFCNVDNEIESAQLIFSHVMFRHGNRAPLKSYPNDPYKSREFWPDGFGQLTKSGRKLHFELGKFLRKRYLTLLGDGKYSPNKVYVQSSDYDRTIMSAASNLMGFFPPDDNETPTNVLNWIPVPIHTIPIKCDHFVGLERPCKRYEKAFHDQKESSEFQSELKKVEKQFELIKENAGYENATFEDLYLILDALRAQSFENLTLPSWAKDMMAPGSDMNNFFQRTFKYISNTNEMKMLKSGFLLKEMLEHFTQKTLRTLQPDRSLWIYSGHDITVFNFLNSVTDIEPHVPPYASCIFFELYNASDSFYVQLFYKNTTSEDLRPLKIRGCGTKCPLDRMTELFKDIIPTNDFETECLLPSPEAVNGKYGTAWRYDVFGPLIAVIIIVISRICLRRSTENSA